MPEPKPLDRGEPLWGRDLRHAALVVLDRLGPATVGQVHEVLARADFQVHGGERARKRLADALRHEVRRGRAQRVGWGRYAIRTLARTTRWRLHRRWDHAAPAVRDERGQPVVSTEAVDRRRPPIPWTVHSRHGEQLWFTRGRCRWRSGRYWRAVYFGRQREARRRARAGREPPARHG